MMQDLASVFIGMKDTATQIKVVLASVHHWHQVELFLVTKYPKKLFDSQDTISPHHYRRA